MGIPGEELPEVVDALDFIEQIHSKPLHEVPVGNRVAIIGGGNTAIDAVTQAKRLGAEKAVLIYRRSHIRLRLSSIQFTLGTVVGLSERN